MPGWARSTRAMCSACAPTSVAVASSQCSAIQRRRVMALVLASTSVVLPQKHFRGALEAFPCGVALWLEVPLLLLCGLLCRLLRGCLLGCFLGCHLPILP